MVTTSHHFKYTNSMSKASCNNTYQFLWLYKRILAYILGQVVSSRACRGPWRGGSTISSSLLLNLQGGHKFGYYQSSPQIYQPP